MSDKRVLVIDDQPEIIEIITELLELDFEDVIVDACSDSKDAIEKIETNLYKVICTDFNMPTMSGVEIIKSVRSSDGNNKETPFIVFTGDDESVRLKVKDFSDVEIVNKAEDIPKLLKIISSKLD